MLTRSYLSASKKEVSQVRLDKGSLTKKVRQRRVGRRAALMVRGSCSKQLSTSAMRNMSTNLSKGKGLTYKFDELYDFRSNCPSSKTPIPHPHHLKYATGACVIN